MPDFERLRVLDQQRQELANDLPDIDRRIAALKAGSEKPVPYFSIPVFLMGLLIVGAMIFAVFWAPSWRHARVIISLAGLLAVGGAYLYVRYKARKFANVN